MWTARRGGWGEGRRGRGGGCRLAARARQHDGLPGSEQLVVNLEVLQRAPHRLRRRRQPVIHVHLSATSSSQRPQSQ